MSNQSDQAEEQHAHFNRSHHDATKINPRPPALYHLNTERKYIDETEEKVRQWTYGKKEGNKKNKVILMVGEVGTGKTTIINTLTNYLLGVKFEDEEFYQITEDNFQTSDITVYEVFVEENPMSLTIIDTPGYGHTGGYEKDREISENLARLFSVKDGIHYIDAVCFVMKASQNRLSGKELYIIHSVLSLFGRDIENNMVFLLTNSDGGRPTDALSAINKAEIPCRRDEDNEPVHFVFSNRQIEIRDKQHEQDLKSTWEMGERSMNEFFTLLEENNRKDVKMTLDVLKERRQLEAYVSELKVRINNKELKTKELTEIKEAITQNRDKIQKCGNFQFTVKKDFKEKDLIENEWWWNSKATCCSICEENCHEKCSLAINSSWCYAMENNHCTVCSGKCHYSKHIRENKKYETKEKTVTMAFDKLKQENECSAKTPETSYDKNIYENTEKEIESCTKEFKNKTETEEKLISELGNIKREMSNTLLEAYISMMILCKIALKVDSAFTLQHLDFLISKVKEEEKDEWIKNLEDLRKTEEEEKNKGALRHLLEDNDLLIHL